MKKTLPFLSLVVALGACEKQPEYVIGRDVLCGERKVLDCEDKNMFCDHYVNIYACEGMFSKGVFSDNETVTGHVVKLDSNETKMAEFFVKNGVVVGDAKIFYQDGKLSEIGHYKNGKLHGLLKEFYPNGNLSSVSKYRNGT